MSSVYVSFTFSFHIINLYHVTTWIRLNIICDFLLSLNASFKAEIFKIPVLNFKQHFVNSHYGYGYFGWKIHRGTAWPPEPLSASKEGLSSMKLVFLFFFVSGTGSRYRAVQIRSRLPVICTVLTMSYFIYDTQLNARCILQYYEILPSKFIGSMFHD